MSTLYECEKTHQQMLPHQGERRNRARNQLPLSHTLAASRRLGLRAATGARACGPSETIPLNS